jgi:hypothetical protein
LQLWRPLKKSKAVLLLDEMVVMLKRYFSDTNSSLQLTKKDTTP